MPPAAGPPRLGRVGCRVWQGLRGKAVVSTFDLSAQPSGMARRQGAHGLLQHAAIVGSDELGPVVVWCAQFDPSPRRSPLPTLKRMSNLVRRHVWQVEAVQCLTDCQRHPTDWRRSCPFKGGATPRGTSTKHRPFGLDSYLSVSLVSEWRRPDLGSSLPRSACRSRTGALGEPIGQWLSACGAESHDVASLPGRFDCPRVVALADVANSLVGGYAIEHSDTGQGSASPTVATAAGDLDPLLDRAAPSLAQRVPRVDVVTWQPVVRPADAPIFPTHWLRRVAEQVQPEVRTLCVGRWSTQPTTPDNST